MNGQIRQDCKIRQEIRQGGEARARQLSGVTVFQRPAPGAASSTAPASAPGAGSKISPASTQIAGSKISPASTQIAGSKTSAASAQVAGWRTSPASAPCTPRGSVELSRPVSAPPPAVKQAFALHPVTADEEATCGSMVARERGARLTLMPTHHVGEFGDLTGFRFDCGFQASGGCLPVSRRMFHGHTLVECEESEASILRLMSDPGRNRAAMRAFLESVEGACEPALLDCIPDNSDAVLPGRGLMQGMDLRTVDCKRWTPEVPELIGVYHAYLRGYNRDVRAHKMFIACSGGLEKASDAFCNLMIDVGKKWTAKEVAESEEAWWLKKACQRSRCRLVKGLADAFGLKVPNIQDIQSHDPAVMAIPCTDTLEHDMACTPDGVSVFNGCCDTTRPINGILVRMHPAEGMWLFRGASRGGGFGTTFGDRRVCGAFPVTQPRVARATSVAAPWSDCVVRLRSAQPAKMERYMCFDEAYFRTLERMQWDRDNGHMELMPIVVGMP